MVLLFWYAIIGVYLGAALFHPAHAASTQNMPATEKAPLNVPAPKTRKKAVEKKPPSQLKKNTTSAASPIPDAPVSPTPDEAASPIPAPSYLKPLKGKVLIIDARRLKDHKLTETIRFIQNKPDTPFKLINMTIDSNFIIPLMTSLKKAQVLDQIRDISFVMLPTVNGQVLKEREFIKVLPYLNSLESIELSCLGVTDKIVGEVARKLPHLRKFSGFGDGITDAAITNFVNFVPDITKINLINTRVTSRGLRILVTQFPKLRNLGISGQNLKDTDLLILKEGGLNLHSFSMIGQTFKDMSTVSSLLESMPNLHSLDLSESNVTNDVAKAIADTLKKLKVLNISETQITFEGIKSIVENQDLTTLKIDQLKDIGDKELAHIITSQPGLRKFHFAGAHINDASIIKLILNLSRLIDVTLIPVDGSKWSLSDGVVEAIIHKKTPLQYLHIQHERFRDDLRMKLEKGAPKIHIEYVA